MGTIATTEVCPYCTNAVEFTGGSLWWLLLAAPMPLLIAIAHFDLLDVKIFDGPLFWISLALIAAATLALRQSRSYARSDQ